MHRLTIGAWGNALVVAMIVVNLDIFSGRPNPEWTLTAKEEAELSRRITGAPTAVAGVTTHDEPLGYRGFRVRTAGAVATPAELRVYNGWITGAGQTREDRGRIIERWLLDTGRIKIPPDLAQYVDREIGRTSKKP